MTPQEHIERWLAHNYPLGLIQIEDFVSVVRVDELQVIRVGDVIECAVAEPFKQKWGTFQYFKGTLFI